MVTLTLGTRGSPLALWQAHEVKNQLIGQFPDLKINIQTIITKGDQITDRPLYQIGGKGLFLKEIEQALINKKIDFAVHSMKDVPHQMDSRLKIAAILKRGSPDDVAVFSKKQSVSQLKKGALIGSASLRRQNQLKKLYPHLNFAVLRGNIATRLQKLKNGAFDAIILAKAALKRLEITEFYTETLKIVPAVGQGAIGVQVRENDSQVTNFINKINHLETSTTVEIERYFLGLVEGDCQTPIGCHAKQLENNLVELSVYFQHQKRDYFFAKELKKAAVFGWLDEVASQILKNNE